MSQRIDWTPERTAKLHEMFASGMSLQKIGDALGICKHAVSRKCDWDGLARRALTGGNLRPRKSTWSDIDLHTLKTMWAAGSSQAQIAVVIGCSRNGVAGQIHKHGLKRGRTASEAAKQKPRSMPSILVAPRPYISPPPSPSEPKFTGPLQDFPQSGCRFPRGDFRDGTFQCCAQPTGGQIYCGFHRGIAYSTHATNLANARAKAKGMAA